MTLAQWAEAVRKLGPERAVEVAGQRYRNADLTCMTDRTRLTGHEKAAVHEAIRKNEQPNLFN